MAVDTSTTKDTPQTLPPRLRFAIDGNEANVSNRVGSNVYAFEIVRHLELITRNRPDISSTILLSAPPQEHLPTARVGWEYLVVSPSRLWTQWALPIHIFWHKADYDVLFTPGHYGPRFSSIPYVSSVMDLAFLKFPDDFKMSDLLQLKAWTEYSVKRAATVVAISEFTKKEIVRYYNKSQKDIVVAYPDISLKPKYSFKRFVHFLKAHQITGPYILSVGTIQPRKNLIRLIEAFENIADDITISKSIPQPLLAKKSIRNVLAGKQKSKPAEPLKLVLAGKIGWLAEEILQKINQSPLKDRIIMTGFVPDDLKSPLYEHSVCTAMVSPYEGFGIPALEAMASGGIAMVANTASLPEVVGDAGILVNPNNAGSIANGLLQTLHLTAKERSRLIKLGQLQCSKFSWQQSATAILQILESLADKSLT